MRQHLLKIISVISIILLGVYLSVPSFLPSDSKLKNYFINNPINLGLDLRGGVAILLDVDVNGYIIEKIKDEANHLKLRLKSEKLPVSNFKVNDKTITFIKGKNKANDEYSKIIRSFYRMEDINLIISENNFSIEFKERYISTQQNDIVDRTVEIIRRRVDETGTREIELVRQGNSMISLQVPGLEDPEELKRLLGKTAKLSFHLVDENISVEQALKGRLPRNRKLVPFEEDTKQFIVIESKPLMSGENLVDASTIIDSNNTGRPVVNFRLNHSGARIFDGITSKNVGKRLAIVLDGKIISAPAISTRIPGGQGVITGNFSIKSANELALLLRAGALPADVKTVEERVVGATLGADSIEAGKVAAIIGATLIVLFMVVYYRFFGVIASTALILNLVLLVAILSLFNATLTLPGIAGIVLTMGMAVDANVLIFERIREEMKKTKNVFSSINAGYNNAFVTILDSNITTIIAALILYFIGSGPVRGFGVTLSAGITCSMFTAVTVSKLLTLWWYHVTRSKTFPFMKENK